MKDAYKKQVSLLLDILPEVAKEEGFIFFMLCGKRPIYELLRPHPIDQSAVFKSQFAGMTDDVFGYDEYENMREILTKTVNESLTKEDKDFLLAFAKGEPDWTKMDYSSFPAIRWKQLNIKKLKKDNPRKFAEQIEVLGNLLISRI